VVSRRAGWNVQHQAGQKALAWAQWQRLRGFRKRFPQWEQGEPMRSQLREAEALLEAPHRRAAEDALQKRQWAEAVKHLDALIKTNPAYWPDRLDRGRALTELGQAAKAEADFAGPVESRPGDPHVRVARGRVYAQLSQWDKAAADFAKGLELLPDDPLIGSARNQVCWELAWQEKVFTRVAALRPADGPLWVARGRRFALQSEWDKAAAAYAKAADSLPVHDAAIEHACLRLLVGDAPGYRQFTRRLSKRAQPVKDPFTALELARTWGLAPQSPADARQAVRWGEQAVAWQPRLGWYLHTLGLAHYRAGQFDKALRRLQESDRSGWGNATVVNWLALALVHQRLGQTKPARQWLDKAADWLDKAAPKKPGQLAPLPATDWLEAQVLRREAEDLVKGKKPAPKK
jgi:tetratricopeptide (TPR) repeat protein